MRYSAEGAFPEIFKRRVRDEAKAAVIGIIGSEEAATWTARRLRAIGYTVTGLYVVAATSSEVEECVRSKLENDVLVMTGGVEPGVAPAFEGIAAALGKKLVQNEEAKRLVEQHYYMVYREQGYPGDEFQIPEEFEVLYTLPDEARVIPNSKGLVPGIILEEGDKIVVCLPANVTEVSDMFEDDVDPYVRSLLGVSLSATINVVAKTRDQKLLSLIAEEVARSNPWIFTQVKQNIFSKEGRAITLTVFARAPEELSEKLENAIKIIEETLRVKGIEKA
ncbi:MAG: molybdopterin-binding protein [Thermofilaceae archaeon]